MDSRATRAAAQQRSSRAPGGGAGADRQAVSRFVGDVARRIGGTLDLQHTLDQVAQAVVELLGFSVAVLNLRTPEDDLEVVTVAGPERVRDRLMGTRESLAVWQRLLASAHPVGGLRFADAAVDVLSEMAVWIPELTVGERDDERAWQPDDALFAPLHGADGQLLGVLSVDVPVDGLRPDQHTCELLELFAVQASLALDHARVHTRLRRSEALFQRTFEHSPVGMAVVDARRRYVRVNPAYCRFMGRTVDQLLGRSVRESVHPEDAHLVDLMSDRVRRRTDVSGVERRFLRPDGTQVWGRVSLIVLEDEEGQEQVLASVEDVTDARATAAELVHRAGTDPLTGLANRATFDAQLAGRLAGPHQLAVLFCDLDRFKVVNDTVGHAAGDQLLQQVAERISGALRDQDLAARLGGDEFVLLVDRVEGPAHALAVAERVRAAVRVEVELPGGPVLTSMTLGVALSEPGVSPAALLARADRALYRAKRHGRDRVELAGEQDAAAPAVPPAPPGGRSAP